MEFKIGQRVKDQESREGVVISKDDPVYEVNFNDGSVYLCSKERLSPLYKPGDQVRVKSMEVLESYCNKLATQWYEVAEKVMTLQKQATPGRWFFDDGTFFNYKEELFEWYSARPEEKPVVGLDLANPESERSTVIISGGQKTDKKALDDFFERVCRDINENSQVIIRRDSIQADAMHLPDDDSRAIPTRPLSLTTSDNNPVKVQWRCPEREQGTGHRCKFTGKKQDVADHLKDVHKYKTVPEMGEFVWQKWRVW